MVLHRNIIQVIQCIIINPLQIIILIVFNRNTIFRLLIISIVIFWINFRTLSLSFSKINFRISKINFRISRININKIYSKINKISIWIIHFKTIRIWCKWEISKIKLRAPQINKVHLILLIRLIQWIKEIYFKI
jgi:hypothetical protein